MAHEGGGGQLAGRPPRTLPMLRPGRPRFGADQELVRRAPLYYMLHGLA
jgi:hypothetical protein